jgi:hypothetical protein
MILAALTILLAVFLILIILRATSRLTDLSDKHKNLPLSMTIFIAIWLIYISILSTTEILADFTMPPRIPVLVIFPLLAVMIFTLFKKTTSAFLSITSVSWLIYIQGFRIIVELIIWGAYREGIVPLETTFEGYNFDILIGLTAVPLAYYAKNDKVSPLVLMIWNIAGILILGNTVRFFLSSVYFPELLGQTSTMVTPDFVKLPYLLIPGMFMPLALYIHALSIKQLLRIGKE